MSRLGFEYPIAIVGFAKPLPKPPEVLAIEAASAYSNRLREEIPDFWGREIAAQ